MDEPQAGPTCSRCSCGIGKLAWAVVPVAAVVMFMLLRPEPPPESSIDARALQEHAPRLNEDMDRYAQPAGAEPKKNEPSKPAAQPALSPGDGTPAKPADPQ